MNKKTVICQNEEECATSAAQWFARESAAGESVAMKSNGTVVTYQDKHGHPAHAVSFELSTIDVTGQMPVKTAVAKRKGQR